MFFLLILLAGSQAGNQTGNQAESAPAPDPAPLVSLASFELTALSKTRTEGRAILAVTNKYSFEIPSLLASCRVLVNGKEIGSGSGARKKKLRPGKMVGLEIPFRADHDRFVEAAGGDWFVGASVDAQLEGSLTLRLPSGDVSVPLKFSHEMGTDGARSGVFGHAPGATSLSPR
jgi:hypothetical protein